MCRGLLRIQLPLWVNPNFVVPVLAERSTCVQINMVFCFYRHFVIGVMSTGEQRFAYLFTSTIFCCHIPLLLTQQMDGNVLSHILLFMLPFCYWMFGTHLQQQTEAYYVIIQSVLFLTNSVALSIPVIIRTEWHPYYGQTFKASTRRILTWRYTMHNAFVC